ncbi:MAG: hypothetical protein CMH69_19140 [Nitratireductor sp.]|nr:hypothetical protein [Nitratireductor sp.]
MSVAVVGAAVYLVAELWALTWRKDAHTLARLDALVARGDKVAAVFWHGSYFPLFALARGRAAAVLTSASFRGYVIAFICRRYGYEPVILGEGTATPQVLIDARLKDGASMLAIAPDGPVGPFGRVKPGFVRLAADLDLRVVPIGVRAWPTWKLKRRWDKRRIPLPFARVSIVVGTPIDLPRGLDRTVIGMWQETITDALDAVQRDL